MNESCLRLLAILSDGQPHSGEVLGEALRVSRAAVWKQVQALQAEGVEIESVRGAGYCLVGGLSLLSEPLIRACLSESVGASDVSMLECEVLTDVDSTNEYVLKKIRAGEQGHGFACVAECQSAGRGRRGRVWQSPFGRNIYLSVGWRFSGGVAAMEGLSLAIGVAVCRSLRKLYSLQAELKWPNDILVGGQKLGGVLLEIAGDLSGECFVVAGVGLNVAMPSSMAAGIDQPWVDLQRCVGVESAVMLDRNALSASLLFELSSVLEGYEAVGFAAYAAEWESHCSHIGELVELRSHAKSEEGRMLGVDSSGALRLMVEGEERLFSGGELSLRVASV